MGDRILTVLSISILVLTGCLLLGSGVKQFVAPADAAFVDTSQYYVASGLLAASVILLIGMLASTRHPFFEIWIVIAIGLITGVIYVF